MFEYSDNGFGETLLFIHGYLEDKSIWKEYEEYFSQSYRVICVDLPGFGETPLLKENIDIPYLSNSLHQFIKEIGLASFHLLGHSLGGYVALEFTKNHSERVKTLSLIHSTAFPDSQERKKLRNKGLEFIAQKGLETFVRSFVPPLFYYPEREKHKAKIDNLKNIASKTPEHVIKSYTLAMRDRESYISVLKTLELPLLFIHGNEDVGITVEQIKEQVSLTKKGKSLFIEKAGHMGFLEKPDLVITEIEKFIQ